jgi:excisionase family DNA binding protein
MTAPAERRGAANDGTSGRANRAAALVLAVELTADQIDVIAERVALMLADRASSSMPTWLGTVAAATYLCCSPGRIHDLVALGKLTPRRDGRRLLFRRNDLDAYLEGTA